MPAEPGVAPDAESAGVTDSSVADARTIDGLTRVLAKACRQLGDAGRPEKAAALAAEGWALLRGAHANQADRLDGTMHYLARLEE